MVRYLQKKIIEVDITPYTRPDLVCAALLGLTPSCGPAPGPGAPPTSVATLPALSLRSRHVLADTWLGLGSSRGKLVGMAPSNLGLWPGEAVTQMAGTLSSRPSCSRLGCRGVAGSCRRRGSPAVANIF